MKLGIFFLGRVQNCNMFPEDKKRVEREKQFPIDLQNAYEQGKSFVVKERMER